MSPLLLLPLTPRFIALTLAILSMVGFAIALAFDQQPILLAICFSGALFLTIVGISPNQVATFADMYPSLAEGELVAGSGNPRWRQSWDLANAHSFRAVA